METYFYCQSCDKKITIEQLALLENGQCPQCKSIEGFSSLPRSQNDTFDNLTVVNDTELLEKTFQNS